MPHFLNLSPQEIEQKFQDLIWLERSRLQNSVVAPHGRWTRVSGPHLRLLDRYGNIQPWDRNRVRLKVSPGQVDYINASPIVLTSTAPAHTARPPDRYIAMQGPKQCSVGHVWRMVYEQMRSPAVIVMLTETHEGSQEKCFPYFPRRPEDPPMIINEHDEFGDGFLASVHCEAIEETPYGDAIDLRRIVLRVHKKASPAMLGRPVFDACSHSDTSSRMKDLATDATGTKNNATKSRGPLPISSIDGRYQNAKNDLKRENSDTIMSEVSARFSSPGAVAASAQPSAETDGSCGGEGNASKDYEDERIVYHFLFKRWPDFGVPALEDLDSFLGLMRLSAEKNAGADNPRIVHCSAGVGRSGTFIALEHLLLELEAGALENFDTNEAFDWDEAENEFMKGADDQKWRVRSPLPPQQQRGSSLLVSEGASTSAASRSIRGDGILNSEVPDPIYATVNQLREQRRTMVQAESQYHLIYQVLRKLWKEKYDIPESDDGLTRRQSEDSSGGGAALDVQAAEEADVLEPAAKRFEMDPATVKR
ncbi:hypothetical protein SEPCBS57363_004767 [Sporothrix epigloea]|uniref:Uncharacterized protein n=1 Tax=Sporothrix epigloea TaxID=1892477 RepID=A0ABP0DTV2_9PEZI